MLLFILFILICNIVAIVYCCHSWVVSFLNVNAVVDIATPDACNKTLVTLVCNNILKRLLGLFRSSKSSSICSTGRPETSIDCLFYWSIFPIIYYAYLHTLKLSKSAWNLRLLRWRMKKTWPAAFVDMWTAHFRSFTSARDYDNRREFKRFSGEKTWRNSFSSAFAQ